MFRGAARFDSWRRCRTAQATDTLAECPVARLDNYGAGQGVPISVPRALASVASQNSSRSRFIRSCRALNAATRLAISARSESKKLRVFCCALSTFRAAFSTACGAGFGIGSGALRGAAVWGATASITAPRGSGAGAGAVSSTVAADAAQCVSAGSSVGVVTVSPGGLSDLGGGIAMGSSAGLRRSG